MLNDEVGAAVAVEVAAGDAHAGQCVPLAVEGDPGGLGNVPEAAVPQVLEEPARGAVVDDEISGGVAGQVGDQDAEPPAVREGDPGLLGDVGEGAVAVVPVQAVGLRGESSGPQSSRRPSGAAQKGAAAGS